MPKSIVILENDLEIRTILKEKLEENGYLVHCPIDSYVALEHAKSKGLDLIVLNDDMPLINGQDTLRILRDSNIQVPAVVFLSQFQTSQNYTEFKSCVCIHKPFQIKDLTTQVNHLLNT